MNTDAFRFCAFCGGHLLRPDVDGVDAPRCARCKRGFYSAPHPTVAAIVEDEPGRCVLLARRKHEPFQGYWDIPGGFVAVGETVEEALERELHEELGVSVHASHLLCTLCDVYKDEFIPTINIFFLVVADRDQFSTGSDVSEIQWFDLNSIPELIAFDCVRQAIDLWRGHKVRKPSLPT